MELRPYQREAIESITADWAAGVRNVLAVLPTGAGKTSVFLSLLCDEEHGVLRHGGRGLVVAHRQDLIDQPLARVRDVFPSWSARTGVVMGERNQARAQLVIASVQTLSQPGRLAQVLRHGPISHLIVDEAHRATAPGYRRIVRTLQQANPGLRHLGVTATPLRAEVALGTVYQHCAVKLTLTDLIPQYLVPPTWRVLATGIPLAGVDERDGDFVPVQLASVMEGPAAFALMVDGWKSCASDRLTMAFTVSVDGAYRLAEQFRRAGVSAVALDGTSPREDRRAVLRAFRAGEIQVLCNAMLFTEGLDVPEIACVLVGRPTRSDSMYLQMVGRGLRLAEGKQDCLVLDVAPADVRNIVMAGDVLGVPTPKPTMNLIPKGTVIAPAGTSTVLQPLDYFDK